MIYLDWSPALKFHVRCTVHDTLATGSFDTMPGALYATSLHRIDYACDEEVEDIGQGRVKALDQLRSHQLNSLTSPASTSATSPKGSRRERRQMRVHHLQAPRKQRLPIH